MLANPRAGLGAVALPVTAASDGQPGSNRATPVNAAYIVQMADMPVTAYQGGTQGYTATKPRKNQKIDPNAPAVVSYMAYLGAKHDRALAGVGDRRWQQSLAAVAGRATAPRPARGLANSAVGQQRRLRALGEPGTGQWMSSFP